MSFKEKVGALLASFLDERKDLFLVDLKISADDQITVTLDGDNGVTLQDCLDASRAIEFNMDREEHDFALQVMSYGLSEPLMLNRQYQKNIGRELDVVLTSGEQVEGELVTVDEESIVLLLRFRRPKLIGKGKEDAEEEKVIRLDEIKKALVVIKF